MEEKKFPARPALANFNANACLAVVNDQDDFGDNSFPLDKSWRIAVRCLPLRYKLGPTTMTTRSICITEKDRQRLQFLLDDAMVTASPKMRPSFESLAGELRRGSVVSPEEVPPDVVTMNSRVRLRDLDSNEEMTYTLVFPDASDITNGKVSILAPIGTAMLGFRVGDTIAWRVPSGERRLRVEEILYQPEASGDFHL